MSRFFRSDDSTSSSEADSEPDNDKDPESYEDTKELSEIDASKFPEISGPTAVDRASADWTNHHRDFLLHALLEERCMNEVISSYSGARFGRRPSREEPQIKAEADAKYQMLCARLASYNLISTGLEGDQHSVTRQRYRDGLDVLSQQRATAAVPQPLRRLLTESDGDGGGESVHQNGDFGIASSRALAPRVDVPSPLRRLITGSEHAEEHPAMYMTRTFTNSLRQRSLSPSTAMFQCRYHDDFKELNMLGRGGYGVVYHVRHRLDNRDYAVKKVPLSTARLHRIQQRGERELEDVLRELRTLARLDHPNIVRYHNGWVEWVERVAPPALMPSDTESRLLRQDSVDVQSGAEDSRLEPVDRIVTESSLDDTGVVFEASDSVPELETSITGAGPSTNDDFCLRRVGTKSTIATVSDDTAESVERQVEPSMSAPSMQSALSDVHFNESTLALHIQMSIHPLNLANFLAPPPIANPDIHAAPPLAHCFHLGPSISILLAILDGIEYLHNEGIVHRDIKPANIFLGPHNNRWSTRTSVGLMSCDDCRAQNSLNPIRLEVRIGDFGLVAVADPDAAAASALEAVGTEIYRPPIPQARHPSLDIYALGIVAFELLWKFNTRMERLHTLQKLKQGEFPVDFIQRLGESRGKAMQDCIESMLALDGKGVSIPELKLKLAAFIA